MSNPIPFADKPKLRIDEMLYSRTDKRGVILCCNALLQRASCYSLEELVGSPHKILRHPAMPAGVFHMIWDALRQKQEVGGFVLNLAKDQQPYWVFATMVPTDGGYLSMRVTATRKHIEMIWPIYDDLRQRELSGELSAEQSAKELLETLKDLGFPSYRDFMTNSLREALEARAYFMKRERDPTTAAFSQMFDSIADMQARARQVDEIFKSTHQIPYNMRLQAGRLEASDGPISVISSNHRQMTQTLEESLTKFSNVASEMSETMRNAGFRSAISELARELILSCETETTDWGTDREIELNRLREHLSNYSADAITAVLELSSRASKFGVQCRDMRRMMSGLELTRIMCKIERSKFSGQHAGLDEIVNSLAVVQKQLGKSFDEIINSVERVVTHSEDINRASRQTAHRMTGT